MTTSPKEKAAGAQPGGSEQITSNACQFNKKWQPTGQYLRLVNRLRHGIASTYDLNALGITNASARVSEVNKVPGWFIATIDEKPACDAFGFWHQNVAHYSLIDEPGLGYGQRA